MKLAGLHRQQLLGSLLIQHDFDRLDEVRQYDRLTVAYIEDAERRGAGGRIRTLTIPSWIRLGEIVAGAQDTIDDIVDIGEAAYVFTIVEQFDRPAFENIPRE